MQARTFDSLETLLANGTIQSLQTCCGTQHAHGSHKELIIRLQNGLDIVSMSSLNEMSVTITVNETSYEKKQSFSSPFSAAMSIFSNENTPKQYVYSKYSQNDTQKINQNEFNAIYKQLPDAIKEVLEFRLEKIRGVTVVMGFQMPTNNDPAYQAQNNSRPHF